MFYKLGLGMIALALSLPSQAGLPDASKLQHLKSGLQKQLDAFQHIQNGSGKCIALPAEQAKNSGTQAILQNCEGKPHQRWNFDQGLLANPAKLCLQPTAAAEGAPSAAKAITCADGTAQTWQPEGSLEQGWMLKKDGMCLSTESSDVNAKAILQNCDGNNPNQKWKLLPVQ